MSVWEIISSIGTLAATVIALVTVVVTLRKIRIEARRFAEVQEIEAQRLVKAQEDATADSRRLNELGVLRELLDSIPSDEEDVGELEGHGNVMVVTDRHYLLLSLLPSNTLPFWRRLAVAVGRSHDREVSRICDDAEAPRTFNLRQRVRRVQRREALEAIQERSGGAGTDVAAWFERLDGRSG